MGSGINKSRFTHMFINWAFGRSNVNRRTYLAVIGSVAAAGCSGTDPAAGTDAQGTDATGTAESPSPSETEAGTETETTTAEESLSRAADAEGGSLEVGDMARLSDVRWDPEVETASGTGAVVGTAENVSGDVLGRLRNRLTLFDDADDVVGTTSESLAFVRSGTTYQFALPLVGGEPDSVARFRLDARAWSDPIETVNDGQVAVSDDEFTAFEDGSYGVRGTVTNESDEAIFRVLPHVNFYDGDELLAYGSDAVTDLGAGESAEWRVPFGGDSPDAVGDHQVVVALE